MTDTPRSQSYLLTRFGDVPVIQGRIVPQDMRDLIVSIGGLTDTSFNVNNFASPSTVINTGVNDATSAILAADAAAGAIGAEVFFPVGTYEVSQNLIPTCKWRGIRWGSILKPTAAVTKCIDNRGWDIEGLTLDGANTSGATGMDCGSTTLISNIIARDVRIRNFGGVGGRGLKVAQLVTGYFENVYCDANYINLHTNGGNTPTDTLYLSCQFRTATAKGVWIETGYSVRFIKPLFESNGEEGFYAQNTAGNAVEIGIFEPWYENNWNSIAAGAGRHAGHYNLFVDGANGPAGTIRFVQMNAKFEEGVTQARAMHITNATGFKDFNSKVANEAGQILVDGTSYGSFEAFNEQNGPFLTTVTNSSSTPNACFSAASHLLDNIESAFTSWVPTITANGGGTFTPTTSEFFYKLVGKTLHVRIRVYGTVAGVVSNIRISLPLSLQPIVTDQSEPGSVLDGTGAVAVGPVRMLHNGDIRFYKNYTFAGNFGTGVGQTGLEFQRTIEVS
jgi:hypothetical protein